MHTNPECCLYNVIRGSLARGRPTALGCIGDTNGPLPRYTRLCAIPILVYKCSIRMGHFPAIQDCVLFLYLYTNIVYEWATSLLYKTLQRSHNHI